MKEGKHRIVWNCCHQVPDCYFTFVNIIWFCAERGKYVTIRGQPAFERQRSSELNRNVKTNRFFLLFHRTMGSNI